MRLCEHVSDVGLATGTLTFALNQPLMILCQPSRL